DGGAGAAGGGASGKVGGKTAHDLPLLAAGILRLVDQKMIDAEIELVVHPGRIDIAEKLERFVDQIVIVDEPTALLFVLVALQNFVHDSKERGGTIAADDRPPPLQKGTYPAPFLDHA